ncbi:MAG: beta-ketoacyl-ACP synthase II [Halorhodospira halophila]|uniref:beta-ketoacyl-ACP synthase II n=1 Tax=Halorhodospira TaxID=85108 RepID=UPI0019126966|nr:MULTISPECIES: beta-ketoacyl-ACP synthase II [Halorhodospira]MBK5936872.1 beta-ketoacyl-[acyl-carrier-protein] synthase II [Halorhodospira halophila]MCC3750342.1 beta-ketoacyl-ACP synthase II [Halorhodospira halophila]MCG5531868.1 beta-ketoacyl-ACP synthase II [Halorhodospira sp. 9621]MCG5537516.1 beta-ketoacyl-ACP synthase II [Halorhodospira sp. 9622]
MDDRAVVVTGLGVVSPVGHSADEAWSAVTEGRSGIRTITEFDTSAYAVQFGGTIEGFDVSQYLPRKEARRMDPFIHYAFGACAEALESSGLEIREDNADRIGLSVGSGIGGILGIETGHQALMEGGPRKVSPFLVPSSVINMAAGNLSIHYGLRGPNLSTVTACAAGTHNLGVSARMIAAGDADVMIAGGAEKCITPLGLAAFSSARALSSRNDDPSTASRPWDVDRDGFVLSEGAAVLVLESYAHARARGATILAELAGFGTSSDAHHITQPAESGEGAQRCMARALEDAAMAPADIDYINAHGTSTQVGDLAEAAAVKRLFGDRAGEVAMSSTKSVTGHLLGAAGGLEAVFSVLALRDGIIPPTCNLHHPEADCAGLDLVPGEARQQRLQAVLSNSFGFGGTNASLIFRKAS